MPFYASLRMLQERLGVLEAETYFKSRKYRAM